MTRQKAAGLSAAFLFSGFLLSGGLVGLGGHALWRLGHAPSVAATAALQSLATLIGFGLATWVFGFRLGGLDATSLRWRRSPGAVVRGLLLGAWPALLAMGLAVPLAGAAWIPDGAPVSAWAGTLPGLAGLLLPAAFVEELAFRGVPLVLLAAAFGKGRAVAGLALLFGMAHLINPEVTPLAVVNVALAGVFLGIVFFLPGGIWTSTAAHFGWNFVLAGLAAPVSGFPFVLPGMQYRPGAPRWLSGGAFGPEGGVLATVVLSLATLVALRFTERPKESSA